jgi:hypothetical protein
MSDVVFILGAGASADCGGPLMSNFLDIAQDLYLSGAVTQHNDAYQDVFKARGKLQAVNAKSKLDVNNIETLYTAFELGKVIQKVSDLTLDQIGEAVESLKRLIVTTLEMRIVFKVGENGVIPHPEYGELAEIIKRLRTTVRPVRSVSVITFNYDVALDFALFKHDLGPDYCLDPAHPTHSSSPIKLMKLHGSLNWAKHGEAIIPLPVTDLLRGATKYALSTGDGGIRLFIGSLLQDFFKEFRKMDVEKNPVIVPPTWNKAEHHTALTQVWARAASELAGAQYIFVVGYSLAETDSFFRHLFALGCHGDTVVRKMVVYDPDDSGLLDGRFRSLVGNAIGDRYKHRALLFGPALKEVRTIFDIERPDPPDPLVARRAALESQSRRRP